MKVQILNVKDNLLVRGTIKPSKASQLPSIQDGWRFNFNKQIDRLKHAKAFVLVVDESPAVIEGALIFEMKDKIIPYMSFVEVASHNRTDPKRYDQVAGCLIAFAWRLSAMEGKGNYKGWLTFDVLEEKEEDKIKLVAIYSAKYNAKRAADTTMYIMDNDGELLVEKYLKRS